MPLSTKQLGALLEFVENRLADAPCEHSLSHTILWLSTHGLVAESVVPWLNEHGGFCDCEVADNLLDIHDYLSPKLVALPSEPKPKRKRLGPVLETGFGITFRVERPWIARQASDESEGRFVLKLGKKSPRCLYVFDLPLPIVDPNDDEQWKQLWRERTGLPEREPILVTSEIMPTPDALQLVRVSTQGWTPALVWVFSAAPKWHLRFDTEVSKLPADYASLCDLLSKTSFATPGAKSPR